MVPKQVWSRVDVVIVSVNFLVNCCWKYEHVMVSDVACGLPMRYFIDLRSLKIVVVSILSIDLINCYMLLLTLL